VPLDSVYSAITNVEAFPRWRSKVKSVERVASGAGVRGFRESGDDGDIRVVSRFAFGHNATIDGDLGALGRKFGAPVTIS
jgi:hypothetical protein